MATFAQYMLNEPDFIKKIEIASFLKKKKNTFFNTSVILKAEITREFMSVMKIDVDKNGELSEWPKGFFDQKGQDLRDLFEIRRTHASH